MSQKTWSAKRERQYAQIKDSLFEREKPAHMTQKIAARVDNKKRARGRETVQASAMSLNDLASGSRSGLRVRKGEVGRTLAQLRNEARQHGIKGSSSMSWIQLEEALQR